jgi:hypothetical protein
MQRLAIGGGATIGIVTCSDRERGLALLCQPVKQGMQLLLLTFLLSF